MPKIIERWPVDYIPPSWLPDWKIANEYEYLTQTTKHELELKLFDIEYSDISSHELCKRTEKTFVLNTTTIPTQKQAFAWEFLRRNPIYQADYEKITQLAESEKVTTSYKKPLGFNIFDLCYRDQHPPSIPFHTELYTILEKWGLGYYLLDPAKDLHNTGSISAVSRLGNDYYPATKVHQPQGQKPIPIDGGIIPDDNQGWWLFDSSLPIGPQIKKAESFLKEYQKRKYGKIFSASGTEDRLYPLFLRLLDADAHKVDTVEILPILYADRELKAYSQPLNHHWSPARKEISTHRKTAYALRDSDYKLLL